MRNSALYPSIFADEYTYSTSARLMPIAQSPIANYLYLLIYRLTNFCGDGFLSCARILNTLFFILACPFIYQTAKRVCSKSLARYITILALVGPINIYTANFMPEAMYFFAFWAFAWFALSLNSDSRISSWLGVGTLIGLCMLIKPHGVFLLIPTIFYLIILFRGQELFRWSKFAYSFLAICIGALIIKMTLGYLIAGATGLSLLGHLYSATTMHFASAATAGLGDSIQLSGISTASLSSQSDSISLIPKWANGFSSLMYFWLVNLRGHILGLSLLYGIPLLIIFQSLSVGARKNPSLCIQRRYAWFAFIFVASLLLFSSLYSGFISLSYGGEILRIHMRYYNFSFPLLLMVLPAVIATDTKIFFTNKSGWIGLCLWGLMVLLVLWAGWKSMAPYMPSAIDAPEVRGVIQWDWLFYIVFGLALASLALWPKFKSGSALLFLWAIAPILLIAGSFATNQNIFQRTVADQYDRAGLAIKQILNKEELSQLVVVGDNPIELSRVLFYLNAPDASLQVISGDAVYEKNMLPKEKHWVLLMDKHLMSADIQNQIHFNGFTLGGGTGVIKVDFSGKILDLRNVKLIQGLYLPPESWGTWSIGKEVSLVFMQALPEQFALTLEARAFGPN
ncbi:glycosyltransferase family 39 protein, partial [Polynucleobacter sp. 15G-AUS-farblos]|nr:glycosyltransferase family 39 protein [Polynucleobacter sp. 15G-AUS-farblos]